MQQATTSQLAAAFTEWDRRTRENPEDFATTAETLAGTPEEFGESMAPYFEEILDEIVEGSRT